MEKEKQLLKWYTETAIYNEIDEEDVAIAQVLLYLAEQQLENCKFNKTNEQTLKVLVLKVVLSKSNLKYSSDALTYINKLEKQLGINSIGTSESESCEICKEPTEIVTGKICEHKDCVRYK